MKKIMNNKFKTILAVIGILLIGYMIGFYTNRIIVKQRLEKVVKTRISPGFEHRLLDIIALDSSQYDILEPVVKKYGQRLIQVNRESKVQKALILDSLKQDLKDQLSEDQMERLEKVIHRMKRIHEPRKRNKDRHRGKNLKDRLSKD
jgi:hypothetical protein